MTKISKLKLRTLYKGDEIADLWNYNQHLRVISHPQHGLISPNNYRAKYKGKPCPYCGQKMGHGEDFYTFFQEQAIRRGYEYVDKWGNKKINQAGRQWFHPHYVTLDHKLNKARFPERMFEHDNLQVICWRCNHEKGDDNAFDLTHNCDYLNSLAEETLQRYPTL